MAPPPAAGAAATQRTDWNRPAGNDDFLALRNPALLRVRATQGGWIALPLCQAIKRVLVEAARREPLCAR